MAVMLGPGLAVEPFDALSRERVEALPSGEVLDAIGALERLKAWTDYASVVLAGELTRRAQADALAHIGLDASSGARDRVTREARSACADEIGLATGIGYHDVDTRIDIAHADPERVEPLLRGLQDGSLPWRRARAIHDRCQIVPPDTQAQITHAVLTPPRGGAALSDGLFRQRLSRQLATRADLRDSRARGLKERALRLTVEHDGTGTLTLGGGAVRLQGAYHRVDAIARRLRNGGSARTLAQLRADIALDLILYGHLHGLSPAPEFGGPTARARADQTVDDTAVAAHDSAGAVSTGDPQADGSAFSSTPAPTTDTSRIAASAGPAGFTPDSTELSFDPADLGHRLPPASVHVVVGLATLLGIDDHAGQLSTASGLEHLDAWVIREAAMTEGGTWRRLVTDPLDGTATELSTTAYAPGTRLRRAVHVRDRECRVPGCTVPAQDCDIDHDRDHHDGGLTSMGNTSAKHRRHHNHKTRHLWTSHRDEADPTGPITWTTALGRRYTSYPHDYRPLPHARKALGADLYVLHLTWADLRRRAPTRSRIRPDNDDVRSRPPTASDRHRTQQSQRPPDPGPPPF